MCIELGGAGLTFQRQVPVSIEYKGHIINGQRIDLIVQARVVVELKSLRRLPDVATAQALSYLRASGLRRALVINFGESKLVSGIRRVSL